MTILLVEDNDIVAELFQTIIEDLGYKCIHVVSAEDAFKELGPLLPHLKLIVMDFKLPDMSGIRAAILIRSQLFPIQLPIIGVTGGLYTDDVELLEQAHFNFVLQKPILPKQMEAAIKSCLGELPKEAPP